MKRYIPFLAGALIGIGSIIAFGVFKKPAVVAPTLEEKSNTPVTTESPSVQIPALVIGDVNAKLTIIEYGDFQCPICKSFFDNTDPQLRKEYIDTGKAKIEFRVETHIGPESALAGQAAYCANDQKAFTAFHDELYKRQKTANSGQFSMANLKLMANDLMLNQGEFDQCLDSGKYKDAVEQSNKEAKTRISSTPTFFIGSQKIVGAQPFAVFKPVIDSQL